MAIIAMATLSMSAQQVQFGVKGGLNISTESKNENIAKLSKNPDFKAGIHVGGVVNYAINQTLELEADLLYSMQGYNDHIYVMAEQSLDDIGYHVTSHYLTLPIAAKFNLAKGIYVECGPQVGYLLAKKDNMDGFESENTFSSSNTKKFDFGLFAGLGYRFDSGMFVGARYIHGFTGTSKVFDGGKNRNIQVSLGYLF